MRSFPTSELVIEHGLEVGLEGHLLKDPIGRKEGGMG